MSFDRTEKLAVSTARAARGLLDRKARETTDSARGLEEAAVDQAAQDVGFSGVEALITAIEDSPDKVSLQAYLHLMDSLLIEPFEGGMICFPSLDVGGHGSMILEADDGSDDRLLAEFHGRQLLFCLEMTEASASEVEDWIGRLHEFESKRNGEVVGRDDTDPSS